MKTPVPPPPWEGIFAAAQESGPATLGQILAAAQAAGTPAQTRYWPWDKLRFETPPDGLSPEQWWAAVKIGRLSSRRDIPLLLDRDGSPFSYTLPDELLRGIEEIAAHAKGEISTPEAVTDSRTRDRFIVSSLTEEAITSSQLEGASTTRRVAKEMLRTGRPPHDRSERMIQNNYAAMRYVAEARTDPLTPALILKIHEIVTAGTLDDEADAGRVRSDDGIAVRDEDDTLLHQPPLATSLPSRMAALCAFANDETPGPYIPPVLRAIALHFQMGYDHYFVDGNGRTARAVFYWSMLHQGYWLTEFIPISRLLHQAPGQYARSFLYTEQDDGDLTYFFLCHAGVLRRAIRDLHTYLARKAKESATMRRALDHLRGTFNHRQVAVLELAARDSEASFTAKAHAARHHVTVNTAAADLKGLEAAGLMSRAKRGHGFYWIAAPGLLRRLRQAQ